MTTPSCDAHCYELAEFWLDCLEQEHKDDQPHFEYNTEALVKELACIIQDCVDAFAEELEELAAKRRIQDRVDAVAEELEDQAAQENHGTTER